jgi:gamma-glutamyltranspeptidase/glutathione hydrolase
LPELYHYKSSRKYFTKGDSTSKFYGGEVFIQKDLAKTLCKIQKQGRDGFYKGNIAKLIASEIRRNNGILSEDDLASYEPVWRAPLKCTYRGYEIITVPPPSSGGWALISLLKMTEPYRLDSLGFHSSSTIHLMSEAMKRVFADRSEYLGDPDFVNVPISALLDSSFLVKRMSTFDSEKATNPNDVKPGLLNEQESNHTTHYCIADSAGNMVAVTYTLNHGFGSKLAVEGAGFLLNNEMDDFSAKANAPNAFGLLGGSANRIQPKKRMLSSMTPAIVLRNNKPYFTAGAPGGPTIITRVFQVITNVIDYGMNIQDAVTALRFHHQWPSEEIEYEPNAISKDAIINLTAKGWKLREYISWDSGGMDAILIDRAGLLQGAADPRNGDFAIGY